MRFDNIDRKFYKQLVDIIIPVFTLDGLRESLMSVGKNNIVKVYLVDDGRFNDYSSLLAEFSDLFEIEVVQLPENVGQGKARQAGINASSNPFIYFLDCGDLIYSPTTMMNLVDIFIREPDVFFTQFYAEEWRGDLVTSVHIAVNGQMIRRETLNQFDIRFSDRDFDSRTQEDTAFARQCWFVSRFSRKYKIINKRNFTMIKVFNENSISKKDGELWHYKDGNMGRSRNFQFSLNQLDKNNSNGKYFVKESEELDIYYEDLISLIIFYFQVLLERQECAEDSFRGVKDYYLYLINKGVVLDEKKLEKMFNYVKSVDLVLDLDKRDVYASKYGSFAALLEVYNRLVSECGDICKEN